MPSVAQAALSEHVPELVLNVIVATALAGVPLTAPAEHAPLPVMVGKTLAFVVAVTLKTAPPVALAGAPAKLTVGGIVVAITNTGPSLAAL